MFTKELPRTDKAQLSPEHTETIKATLPLVGSKINEITPLFYKTMFGNHPELISDTFNRGNQKSGEQQKALAASIATFAAMLVDPNAPDPREMLSRIGHKHVSLGITRDQYQIVHDNLFHAIVEVLGADVVTADVAEAWDAVYWLMAEVLIDFEHELYESAGVADGDVFQKVTLKQRKQLSDRVMEYTFEGKGFEAAQPGQYVSLGVKLPDGARQLRQYSLVNSSDSEFTVAIQRDGEVSSFLMDEVQVGDQVDGTLPAGDLVLLEGSEPVVLVSQGIGSTPMTGMLAALAAQAGTAQRPVVVLHADANESAYAQREVTDGLVARLADNGSADHIIRYRDEGDRLDLRALLEEGSIIPGSSWYLCGGNGFLQAVRDQLAQHKDSLQPASIHFELFGPNDWLI